MLVIAHRGAAALAPENTVAAFLKCLDEGVNWFQADVRSLADNSLIIAHDEHADRTTTGSGPFAEMTFSDLRRLDAGSWFGSTYRLERVPELASVVELLNGTTLCANLELHCESEDEEARSTFVETVVENLRPVNHVEKLLVSSRHRDLVERLLELNPRIPAGYTADRFQGEEARESLEWADAANCRTLIAPEAEISADSVRDAHGSDLTIWARVVNDTRRAAQLEELGVDGIITEYPRAMSRL